MHSSGRSIKDLGLQSSCSRLWLEHGSYKSVVRTSEQELLQDKQKHSEMMAYTNGSATFDSYPSDESWKRKRLNPKTFAIKIVEQPQLSALKFVKADQAPSAGSYIMGEKSTIDKETHPGFLLTNVRGPVTIVYYLAADDAAHPHPYILEGEDCENGVCTRTVQAEGQIIQFPGLYVRSVSRREVQKSLDKRINNLKKHLSGVEFKAKDTMEYNLNAVRICFQVLLWENDEYVESLKFLLTRSLRSKEPSVQGEPRILSISQCKGSVHGREELSLQVTNLKTDDVFVLFHHESLEPRTSWQAFADVISISRQKAQHVDIVVHTPPYHNQRIVEPQTVAVQLRLMDNSISNTVKFTYTPQPRGVSRIEHRVKQREPIYVRHFTCLGATAHVDPVLKKLEEEGENEADSSQVTRRVKMIVRKLEERGPQTERKRKPLKVDVASQTDERHLRTPDGLEGYDSEEEIGVAEGRVDYDRLHWYRSLMGTKLSPDSENKDVESSNTVATSGIDSSSPRGGGLSQMDFTPAGILGCSGSSKSTNTDHSFQAQSSVGSRPSSSSHGTGTGAENITTKLSNVKLHSPHEGCSSSQNDMNEDVSAPHGDSHQFDLPTEFDLDRQIERSSIEDVCGDDQAEEEESASSNPESEDTRSVASTERPHGSLSSRYEELNEFAEQDIAQTPVAANMYPDLSLSNLFPAMLNDTQLVAIKRITRSHFQEKAYSLWHTIKHKNLIKLLGVIKEKKNISLVLEFPEEGSLKEYLSGSALRPQQTLQTKLMWIQQIAEGLNCLHEKAMAHREVRSENCLISRSHDIMLNIPSALMAKPGLVGESLETDSILEKKYIKADVYSFGVVCGELLTCQNEDSSVSKLLNTQKDLQRYSLVDILHGCQHVDESQRPDIHEVLMKLRDLQLNQPRTSSRNKVPTVKVDIDPHDVFTDTPGDHLTESIPNTPDSGIGPSSQGTATLLAEPEQMDSVTSGESAFSDNSQGSQSTKIVERSVPDDGNTEGQDANQTSSEDAVNETNSNPEQQEIQQSDGIQNGQSLNPSGDSTDGGYRNSNGQDGDQNHGANRRENEGLGSHLCPPKLTKRIDHSGGKLTLLDGEISLEIPPGALREGQVEEITLTVDWNDQHVPPLKSTDMSVSPIVECSPTGLMFEKPVFLQVPHCAVVSNPKHCKMTVHRSNTEEGDLPQWERLSKEDDSDLQIECIDQHFILHVTHFCLFTVTLTNGETSLAKEVMLVVYGQVVRTFEDDQEIRVYLYDSYGSNREKIHQEEQNLSGKQLYAPRSYHFLEQYGNMIISVEYHDKSWLLKSNMCNKFLFRKIWHLRSCDQCKFTWSNASESVKFMCRILAQQEENEEHMLIEISNHVKLSAEGGGSRDLFQTFGRPDEPMKSMVSECTMVCTRQYTESPADLSVDSGIIGVGPMQPVDYVDALFNRSMRITHDHRYSPGPPPIISNELKQSLCQKLDQTSPLGNHWTKLASLFGYDQHIGLWESKQSYCPNFSPTKQVLDLIEQEQKIQSLGDLEKYFKHMNRPDAALVIAEYQKSHEATDKPLALEAPGEPVNLNDTFSFDETLSSLTQRETPLSKPIAGSTPDSMKGLQDVGALGCRVNPSNTNQLVDNDSQSLTGLSGRYGTSLSEQSLTQGKAPSSDFLQESMDQTKSVTNSPGVSQYSTVTLYDDMTDEEVVNMSTTPSPDCINCPLTGGETPCTRIGHRSSLNPAPGFPSTGSSESAMISSNVNQPVDCEDLPKTSSLGNNILPGAEAPTHDEQDHYAQQTCPSFSAGYGAYSQGVSKDSKASDVLLTDSSCRSTRSHTDRNENIFGGSGHHIYRI